MSEVLPCETMAQAVELIEAVEQTGLVYAYAENYCYMDALDVAQICARRHRTRDVRRGEYIHDCSSIDASPTVRSTGATACIRSSTAPTAWGRC